MDLDDETRTVGGRHGRSLLLVVPLPFDRTGPAAARRSVEAAVERLHVDEEIEATLVLIVSELATNAVVHACEPVSLTLTYDAGNVTIEVADGDPHCELVRLQEVDQRGPGGRGLRLLHALADDWGVRPAPAGKTVWARKHVGR